MTRTQFRAMGGFDTRFTTPGGGLVNHDFLKRTAVDPDTRFVVLLGEGSFHQVHGGIATNCSPKARPIETFQAEYEAIYGMRYTRPDLPEPFYFGNLARHTMRFIKTLRP